MLFVIHRCLQQLNAGRSSGLLNKLWEPLNIIALGFIPHSQHADHSGVSGEEGMGLPANPPVQQSQPPHYLGRRGLINMSWCRVLQQCPAPEDGAVFSPPGQGLSLQMSLKFPGPPSSISPFLSKGIFVCFITLHWEFCHSDGARLCPWDLRHGVQPCRALGRRDVVAGRG